MSQHDYDITTADANTGITLRAAINAALQALASNNSGIAPPTVTYAYQFWVDTSTATPTLNQRNADNTTWIPLFQLSTNQWLFVNDILINGVTIGLGGGAISSNSVLGNSALFSNVIGVDNTAIGNSALYSNLSDNNTAVGTGAGSVITTGMSNTLIGRMANTVYSTDSNAVAIGSGVTAPANTVVIGNGSVVKTLLRGYVLLPAIGTNLVKVTANSHSVSDYSTGSIIANYAGTVTLTLPTAASFPGRILNIKTIQNQLVISASANVVPLVGGTATTAILAATASKWATLQSDGTSWQIMAAN
jgi:hypothetical protein